MEPVLGMFERGCTRTVSEDADSASARRSYDYIVFGLGRYGCRIGQGLQEQGFNVLGIDFDPEALVRWREMDFDAAYGDAIDPDFVAHLPMEGVQAVI